MSVDEKHVRFECMRVRMGVRAATLNCQGENTITKGRITWKYLPHTRQAYTLRWESDIEQSFSKSRTALTEQ